MTEILNAETARTITNEKVSKFKDEIFKRISLEAECGYSSCKFNTRGSDIFKEMFKYCQGIDKTELEKLGYVVKIDVENEVVKISW